MSYKTRDNKSLQKKTIALKIQTSSTLEWEEKNENAALLFVLC